jgi:DNA-binding NarL/FixJ family response regulator
MDPIRIVVVDDQALVRDGLRAILEDQPDFEVVGEAGDGAAAVAVTRQTEPDVVLMDVRMPVLDGITATRRITGLGLASRVLVLTTFDLDAYVYEALQAGASGFVLKDMPRDQLGAAVRTVALGESLLAPAVTRRLIERFLAADTSTEGLPPPDARLDRLTEREREVLRLVAQGLSNAEIADALVLGTTTVKSHVASLLRKLEIRDRVQAVVFAYEAGLAEQSRRRG